MPAGLVIGVLALLEYFSNQRILFASLASSAFLIYLDPKHPTNSVRTLIIAQVSAAVIGYLVVRFIGTGYFGAAVSMIIAIVVMILARAMHPPAVSTSLLFAFHDTKASTLLLFLFALLLLVLLLGLQRASLWLVKRGELKRSIVQKRKSPAIPNASFNERNPRVYYEESKQRR